MDRKGMAKDIVVQSIQLVIFYFLMRKFWGTEQWYVDKVKELFFFLSITGLFFLVSLFTRVITSPIRININQENDEFKLPFTTFSIRDRRCTQEYERTIKLQICVERKYSFWGWITEILLKKSDVKLIIVPSAEGIGVQALDEMVLNGVSSYENGFEIQIGKYIERNLRLGQAGDFHKIIKYMVIEDRNTIVHGEMFQISPTLKFDKWYYKFLSIFIRCKFEYHTVHFTRV